MITVKRGCVENSELNSFLLGDIEPVRRKRLFVERFSEKSRMGSKDPSARRARKEKMRKGVECMS